MPLYTLEKPFFGPDHTLYTPEGGPHEFDADWELPPDAKVVESGESTASEED